MFLFLYATVKSAILLTHCLKKNANMYVLNLIKTTNLLKLFKVFILLETKVNYIFTRKVFSKQVKLRVFNPNSKRYVKNYISETYILNERKRIIQWKHYRNLNGSSTPLVMSATGRMVRQSRMQKYFLVPSPYSKLFTPSKIPVRISLQQFAYM